MGFSCNVPMAVKSACNEICGDGLHMGVLSCDDGNKNSGDGCSSTCTVEIGWTCSGGTSTTPDFCTQICGDGETYTPKPSLNYCDDGNIISGDGCSSVC